MLVGRRTPHFQRLADEELMEYVHAGEARAFDVLLDRHGDPAFSLAYRMCGRRALAEEIVQEAFMSVWRSGARYDPARGSVRTWLLRTVHNRAIDTFRRTTTKEGRDIHDEAAAEQLAAPDRTDVEVERRDDARRLRGALEGLPPDQRQVVELAYFAGFSHSEIATMLELPAGTVKGRMRLALAKLRLAFEEQTGATV